jgi:O-acetylserine/cysteine efflux transporter
VLLAARFLHDRTGRQQIAGMSLAFGGLVLIGLTIGGDLKPMALGLALAGALSWAVGNVLVKQARHVPIFPLVVWASLVPPLPALALAGLTDEISLPQAVAAAGWSGIGAALYLGAAATVVGYALWGGLLQRHASGAVAPFALISPCVGVVSSAWLFGESFPPLRLAGMGLIVCGLAVTVLPAGRRAPVRWPCPPSSAWPRDR